MGLKRVIRNMRTVAYSEIELFCCEVLASRMEAGQIDAAPIWTNLKSFPCERFRGMVDLLVAGYPCQPFSSAGKRKGEEDPRHLWPFIERAISDVRPNWVFCENVSGHLTLGFKDVCHDLDELGYEVAAGLFTAREVGLPHKRQRLFILAHDKSAGAGLDERRLRRQPDEADSPLDGVGQADSEKQRIQGRRAGGEQVARPHAGEALSLRDGNQIGIDLAPAGPGSEQYWWEPARVLADGNRRRLRERGERDGKEEERGQQAPRGDDSGGCNAELGNAPSERPRGGSEDCAGEQSEVPRQGLGDAGAGVGQADPARGRQQQREPKRQTPPDSSDTHQQGDGHEAIAPLGRGPDGSTDRLDGPDLLAAYQSLGSSVHSRVDELRALGNGVIPAVSAKAFITLYDELTKQ